MLELRDFRGLDDQIVIDTSEGEKSYLLVGKSGSHIRLSPSAYRLVKSVAGGQSFTSLAQRLSQHEGRPVSPAEVETAYLGVVDRIASIEGKAAAQALPSGFWFRFRLIPGQVVGRLSSWLALAYSPWVALLFVAFIAASLPGILGDKAMFEAQGGALWYGYGLFILSLVAHEFGHASACRRYGARPSDIGFTIYLIYPAFYSDVTAAWQLKRWQRVVVDLGGTYFQFVVGAAFAVAYFQSHWPPLRIAVLFIWYGALFSLNPIFKFDGYWMLADALGVTNLSRQPSFLARYLADRLRGRRRDPLPWPKWVATILAIYTPLTFLVWTYFIARLVPFLIRSSLALPSQVAKLTGKLLSASITAVPWSDIAAFAGSVFFLSFAWVMAWGLARMALVRSARALRALRLPGSQRQKEVPMARPS